MLAWCLKTRLRTFPPPAPYRKRFPYEYRRHAFDKLRAIDLPLRELQVLLDGGEVIAEAEGASWPTRSWCCSDSGGTSPCRDRRRRGSSES